jgi:hypothetical protein
MEIPAGESWHFAHLRMQQMANREGVPVRFIFHGKAHTVIPEQYDDHDLLESGNPHPPEMLRAFISGTRGGDSNREKVADSDSYEFLDYLDKFSKGK